MIRNHLLQVKNLTVQFAGKPVLNNISFTINEGEVLAIVGPSGSGKTTLINALSGKQFSNAMIAFDTLHGNKHILSLLASNTLLKIFRIPLHFIISNVLIRLTQKTLLL